MSKSSKKTWIYLIIFSAFAIAATTLRTIALFFELDASGIYFKDETAIFISAAICILFIPASISYIFVYKQDIRLYATFKNPGTYIPSGIVSVALLFLGGELFAENFIFEEADAAGYFSEASSIISLITTILALVCALNFFFNVFHEKKESITRASFCLLCALFLGCYAGYLFFSDELPINAPNKAADQIAFLALAIFFLFETRISLGRAKWRLYFPLGLIAALMSFYSSIPSIIYMFAERTLISNSLAENVLTLTLGIYVTSRCILVTSLAPDEMSETVKVISNLATRRCEDIKNHEKLRGALNLTEGNKNADIGANYEIELQSADNFPVTQESFNFDEN